MAYEMTIAVTFTEEVLGTASANPELHEDFIASKAPDAASRAEEIEALGVDAVVEKGMTIFPRTAAGNPFLWDYQLKGFFKDSAGALRKVPGTVSSKVKAYKKEIDGLVFPFPRQIVLDMHGGSVGNCQRPIRASTPQGERVALANSETVPAGTTFRCTILCYTDQMLCLVRELLSYGAHRGIGQWRNSGKGRFTWQEIETVEV